MKVYIKKHITSIYKNCMHNMYILTKWLVLSSIVGIIAGAVVTLFKYITNNITIFRNNHPFMLFFLPIAGLIIVWCYRTLGLKKDPGINVIILSLRNQENKVPFKLTPLIMLSASLTHLCGGSAGRTGSALQIGGSIASGLSSLLKLNENDKKLMIMSGISAGFAAILGTPMSATIFSMEVVCVGNMHYSALVPCLFSSLIAALYAKNLGIKPESYNVLELFDFNFTNVLKVLLLSIACALISILFCFCLQTFPKLYEKYFKNPYIRILVGSFIIILLNLILQTNDYQGLGGHLIINSMNCDIVPYAFILKLLLTSLTIGCGFKGGEIMPSLIIGASLGATLGSLLGISPTLCVALGMTGLFCGVTNCPITSILLSFELFGYKNVSYFLIVIAISYMLSGYNSLYREQTILHNKLNE